MTPIRLGLVGIGKIARDQHIPAIENDPRFTLVATASPNDILAGVAAYDSIEHLLDQHPDLDAVSLCTPAAGRHAQAVAAIAARRHVMLEKPPTATLGEIADLKARAEAAGVALFTTWHSREAAGVAPARAWLADKRIMAMRIVWKEDIRRWHPGQEWILAKGGFGVFDPGINALSIATCLLPEALLLQSAWMDVPEGRGAPLAAGLEMRSGTASVTADFDFRETGPQTWDIEVDTDAGTLRLSMGGSVLQLPGQDEQRSADSEYRRLYARFAHLVTTRRSDVDVRPLEIVVDAFMLAERRTTGSFSF